MIEVLGKRLLILTVIFLFVACDNQNDVKEQHVAVKTNLYKIENLVPNKTFYFEYPASALIYADSEVNTISYQGCSANFSNVFSFDVKKLGEIQLKSDTSEAKFFDEYLSGKNSVLYKANVNNPEYYFWLYDQGKDVKKCREFLLNLANSFTDKLMYRNTRYNFKAAILPNFEVQYLLNEEGITMKRLAEALIKVKQEMVVDKYEVEITMHAFENVGEYKDLSEYLVKNYNTFSKEFDGNGVYVNQNIESNAVSHYLKMSVDGKVIYEAILKVPNIHYNIHKQGYENFIRTIEIF